MTLGKPFGRVFKLKYFKTRPGGGEEELIHDFWNFMLVTELDKYGFNKLFFSRIFDTVFSG